jgi:hypothetical protein
MEPYETIIKQIEESINLWQKQKRLNDWGKGVVEGLQIAKNIVAKIMELQQHKKYYYDGLGQVGNLPVFFI